MYSFIDLFCGAGGLSLGFEQAGFIPLLAIDNNQKCVNTYNINRKCKVAQCIDITTYSPDDNLKPHIIIGSPPCQSFSMAGKRDPNDVRHNLFQDFLRIVKKLQPLIVVMENVIGILSVKTSHNEKVIDTIIKAYDECGYRVKYEILNSADYGVPQKRRRVIFLATRKDLTLEIEFPSPTHSKNTWTPVKTVLEEKVDTKYYHSQKMIDGFEKRREKNLKNGKGFGAQYLNLENPSYTISARYYKDGADALVKESDNKIRKLTELEVARIQTFPNTYNFIGSSVSIYQQIGNAVPCLLAKNIAESVKKYLDTHPIFSTEKIETKTIDITEEYLLSLNIPQLKQICKDRNIKGYWKYKKLELIRYILNNV